MPNSKTIPPELEFKYQLRKYKTKRNEGEHF